MYFDEERKRKTLDVNKMYNLATVNATPKNNWRMRYLDGMIDYGMRTVLYTVEDHPILVFFFFSCEQLCN